MNYFNYAIKCVIRNLIYKLMKPRNLIILLISAIVIFLLSSYTQVFGYQGDNQYTDKNNTIIITYDSINQDIVNRLANYNKNNNMYQDFITYLKNNNYSYYAYYDNISGSSMISSTNYATNTLYIKFFDNRYKTVTATTYDMYQGMTTNISAITGGIITTFVFEGNTLVDLESTDSFYIPTVLISYKSSVLYSLLYDDSSNQTGSIVSAINEQTNSINEQTNTIEQQTQVIQDTQDFLTDDSISSSEMTVDSSYTVSDGGVLTFFTDFLTTVKNVFTNIDTTVETITIPLPTGDNIVLYSNLLSKHIINTPIYSLIQAFWWFVFGRYIITFIKRMIDWLSTGEMADKGVFTFIEWLDINNEIIKSYMM